MIEPVEYENGDGLFLPGNKDLGEDNLNLADINPPSASELKAMAQKYGPLLQKDRFMFMDQLRNFWAALNANKLYFYSNEREAKPQNWICIDGYTAKSAPNAVRDFKKKPLCFEVICPANKKLQFIASSPNDMEQWVTAINKGSGSSSNIRSSDTTIPDEDNTSTYEDVDLICASLQGESGSLQGAQNENRTAQRRAEDDAIYYDIDSAFNANITIPQDIYDDTDSSKKFD
ncbi:src kinase-associated phosphoprotein 2-A-like [Ischnura elegans]|uniref:src kinase-associated phosphoprotein 2-A-like n=1 Tax=Ischnura elegans TaxID=197161 RepID=UPI001ED8B145|nr:src kinase-associated phosphoprotein 2-A-like [Ischnura elegans]